jgi:SM-20-related protein
MDSEDAGALPEKISRIVEAIRERGWCVAEDFLDAGAAAALSRECRARWDAGEFRPAGVGSGRAHRVETAVRGDRVLWLDEVDAGPAARRYLAEIEALRLALNASLFLGLFRFEAHFAVYPPGAFYRVHLDRFQGTRHRVVSVVLYLNPEWGEADGGELRLYLDGKPEGAHVDVPPRGGTLAAFLSERFYHEVLPAKRERLSVTGWLRTRS